MTIQRSKLVRALLFAGGLVPAALPLGAIAQNENEIIEEVLVTGVPQGGSSRLEASVSVSSVGGDDMTNLAPRSTAEIFRSLPGIRAESSGGGGNANLTVRGIPLATGGSKYLQIHEDGLPVLEYGDINFGNTDNWIRADWSVSRIESIRGGSASTFASNSPGGIINMISKTGQDEGGAIGFSFGADYEEFRTDFDYGGSLGDDLYFHVGGFYREGEGIRDTGFNGDTGGQVKANITKEFDSGFVRLYLKHLDDRVTTYLPAPVVNEGDGNFATVAGFDASTDVLHSAETANITTFDQFGNPVTRSVTDGIESKVTAIGLEIEHELANGVVVNNKLRSSDISGGFIAPFTDGFAGGTDTIANKGAALCSGASAGGVALDCTGGVRATINGVEADPNQLAFTNLLFDADIEDLGLLVNNLSLAYENDKGFRVSGGVYYSKQNIATSWRSWHARVQTLESDSRNVEYAAIGAGIDAEGNAVDVLLSDNGAVTQSFLSWNWDLEYTTVAPFLNIGFDVGDRWSFDFSARRDDVRARGQRLDGCCGGTVGSDLNGSGQVGVIEVEDGLITRLDGDALLENPMGTSAGFIAGGVRVLNENSASTSVTNVNYDTDNFSYSLGGTLIVTDNSSVFMRFSEGARAVADRLTQVPGSLNPDGSLASTTDGFDNVRQFELGYKHQADRWSLYATLFNTVTDETQAELTSGLTFVREYEATGVELEGDVEIGAGFSIRGNVTWTDAEITDDLVDDSVIGNDPRRQADFIYTLIPQYRNDQLLIGAAFQGTTEYFLQDNNDLFQEGYTLVNLFANWYVTDRITAYLNVNNLTDEFALTEAEEGSAPIGAFVRGRPVNGRSTSIGFSYAF